MAEYVGSSMVVKFGSTTVSEQLTEVKLDAKAADPDVLDCTHAGDTSHQELEGLAGVLRSRVTVTCWDTSDGAHALLDLAPNDTGTLYIYPEGTGSGNEIVTLSSSRLLGTPREWKFNELTKVTAEFLKLGGPSYSTV